MIRCVQLLIVDYHHHGVNIRTLGADATPPDKHCQDDVYGMEEADG